MPSDATERWFELAAQFAVPGFDSHAHEPEAASGQLRQAEWATFDAIVLIDEIDDDSALAHVYPVSVEANVADGSALVIAASDTPLAAPLTVWPLHAHWIPFAALDGLMVTLAPELIKSVQAARTTVRAHHDSTAVQSSGATLAFEDLLEAMDVLEEAPRLGATQHSTGARLDMDLGLVIETLNIDQSRAMDILYGAEPVSQDEADALGAASGVSSAEILNAVNPLPEDLSRELQEPRWRTGVRRRSAGGNEQVGRTRLGYDIYQLAARQHGNGRDIWRQRLETFLQAEEQ